MNRPEYVTCIARSAADGRVTWCGRYLAHVGFAFESIDHAAENNLQRGRLVPCLECRDAVIAALKVGAEDANDANIQ